MTSHHDRSDWRHDMLIVGILFPMLSCFILGGLLVISILWATLTPFFCSSFSFVGYDDDWEKTQSLVMGTERVADMITHLLIL